MPELITLITPTGGRREAFALCEQYMRRQTVWSKHPIQWIVIDDYTPVTSTTLNQEYHRGPKDWREGLNTQRLNMDLALKLAKGDYIFTIEDDDWYSPKYLETMVNLLNKEFVIVGEANAKYYNVHAQGYKEMLNYKHASLCQTGINRKGMDLLEEAINSGDLYFDVTLWKKAQEKKIPSLLFSNLNLSIGIKGMPGRGGIGVGHTQKDMLFDTNFEKLTQYITSDVNHYRKFSKFNIKKG